MSTDPGALPRDPEIHPEDPRSADPYSDDVIAGREPGAPIVRGQGTAVTVVALGGAIGAVARYEIGLLAPAAHGTFPTSTFLINVVGSLLMGVLVVMVTEARDAHPLWRPFLGVGILGGFTTFSTFSLDGLQLLQERHLAVGGLYLAGTVLACVAAAATGLVATRRLAVRR